MGVNNKIQLLENNQKSKINSSKGIIQQITENDKLYLLIPSQ
jgi:hypothetical protein